MDDNLKVQKLALEHIYLYSVIYKSNFGQLLTVLPNRPDHIP